MIEYAEKVTYRESTVTVVLKTVLLFWVCCFALSYSFMMLSWIFSASSLAFSARSSSNCSNKTQSASNHKGRRKRRKEKKKKRRAYASLILLLAIAEESQERLRSVLEQPRHRFLVDRSAVHLHERMHPTSVRRRSSATHDTQRKTHDTRHTRHTRHTVAGQVTRVQGRWLRCRRRGPLGR